MTEEVKVEPQVEVPAQESAPEYSNIEKQALEMGWRPKTEFSGDEDSFIDAKEFVNRKPLFDKIDSQGRALKSVTKALEEFKQHYGKMEEAAYNRALVALKAERKQAFSEGDGDKFETVDAQIKEVEKQAAALKVAQTQPAVQEEAISPEFQNWKARNPWYESVGYMTSFANDFGTQFAKSHPSIPPLEVLKEVEKAIRKEFPQKFTNPNKASAPGVENSGSGSGKTARGGKEVELSDIERKVMNDLIRTKVLTKEEYMADIRKLRGVA